MGGGGGGGGGGGNGNGNKTYRIYIMSKNLFFFYIRHVR